MNRMKKIKTLAFSKEGKRILGISVLVISSLMIIDAFDRYYNNVSSFSSTSTELQSVQSENDSLDMKIRKLRSSLLELEKKGTDFSLFKNHEDVTKFFDSIKNIVEAHNATTNVSEVTNLGIYKGRDIYGIRGTLSIVFNPRDSGSNMKKMDSIVRFIDSYPMKKDLKGIEVNTATNDISSVTIRLSLWSNFKYE